MTDLQATTFRDLNLIDPLLKALDTEGYQNPTPIQQKAIPHVLAGRDLLGCAQTGTGKTAAFALPILQLLASHTAEPASQRGRAIRALILTPTRELAAQIAESFERYGAELKISTTVVFGGVGQGAQVNAFRRGVDVLVATPGRLLDLVEQRHVDLSRIEIFVLDEADRMLDMGFVQDVRRLIKLLPKQRHSLFFSATMPRDIQQLAQDILVDPVKVEVTPVATTAEKIAQSVYFVEGPQKRRMLQSLMQDPGIKRALVFSRTKHGADKIARFLNQVGVHAEAIHGNKSQNNRTRALNNFKEGNVRVLVATDIAARGIDIDDVTHVINYELPNIPESYVHRIGRTARAGAEGIAFSFCDQEEREYLRDIEKLIRMKIPVAEHTLSENLGPEIPEAPRPPRPPQGRRQAPRGGRDNQRSAHAPRTHGGGSSRRGGHAAGPRSAGPRPPRGPHPARQGGTSSAPSAPSAARTSDTRVPGALGGGPRNAGVRPAGTGSGRRRGRGGRGRNSGGTTSSTGARPPRAPIAAAPVEAPKKKSWWKKFLPDAE